MRNINASNGLLSRLVEYHGGDFKSEPVIIVEAPLPEPEPPPPIQDEWIMSIDDGPRAPTIKEIKLCVCRHFKISPIDMDSPRRAMNLALPRQVAMYLARTLTPRTFPEIAKRFGGRDHSTAVHAAQKIARMIESDRSFAATVRKLEAQFR
ncbi:helix-turn-helix domain-containing protein [Bradyrhizobium centrolobii]|uniref:helix-turn-helix domain-containing protein n=1 Tax=Bradyrhizobium centrolobii TaxID=1505087 RepID=UPI001374712C|nr:helix-turn-helix domain-containing protein [Bradyrhizobium centrolobii]